VPLLRFDYIGVAMSYLAKPLIECFDRGGKVLICGNGGSAAHAQHFAAELMVRYKKDRHPLPAIALTTDTSVLTAIANDFGFEHVFSRQIEALANGNDLLVTFSISGESPNIKKALE